METTLLDLGDPLLHLIIDAAPNRARRQLRCVNRRLRALVDEHLTDITLADRGVVDPAIFEAWERYPNVKTLTLEEIGMEAVPALLATRWPLLEKVSLSKWYASDGNFSLDEGLLPIGRLVFAGVKELSLVVSGTTTPESINQSIITKLLAPSNRN